MNTHANIMKLYLEEIRQQDSFFKEMEEKEKGRSDASETKQRSLKGENMNLELE